MIKIEIFKYADHLLASGSFVYMLHNTINKYANAPKAKAHSVYYSFVWKPMAHINIKFHILLVDKIANICCFLFIISIFSFAPRANVFIAIQKSSDRIGQSGEFVMFSFAMGKRLNIDQEFLSLAMTNRIYLFFLYRVLIKHAAINRTTDK